MKMEPKVHYCIHKSLLLLPILNKINISHSFPTHFRINFNIIISSTTGSLQMVSFPHDSQRKPCMISLLSILATCPAHLILLHLITRIILVISTDHNVPRYVVFCIPVASPGTCSFPLRRPLFPYIPVLCLKFWCHNALSLRDPTQSVHVAKQS